MNNTVQSSTKLPQEAKTSIEAIAQCGNELLSFLQTSEKNYSLNEDMMNFTAIFDKYLPKIINQYERLPTKYANEVKSSNGKTAKDMLMEQLSMLERKVQEIAYGMYEDDVTALRVNGNFLKEKFGSDTNLFEIHNNHMNAKK